MDRVGGQVGGKLTAREQVGSGTAGCDLLEIRYGRDEVFH